MFHKFNNLNLAIMQTKANSLHDSYRDPPSHKEIVWCAKLNFLGKHLLRSVMKLVQPSKNLVIHLFKKMLIKFTVVRKMLCTNSAIYR